MSKPLTHAELNAIAEKTKEQCDSADEGMTTMTFVQSIDPDEIRKMYGLTEHS